MNSLIMLDKILWKKSTVVICGFFFFDRSLIVLDLVGLPEQNSLKSEQQSSRCKQAWSQ